MNRIRQDYQALLRRCAEQNGGCTAARIGFFSAWDLSALLPGIRARVAEQCPGCALRLEAYSFRELVERLESGALDAILSVRTAVPVSSGLDVTLVGQTRAVLIYAAGHPLHTPGHPTLADFHKDTFLVQPSEECPYSTDSNQSYFLSQMMQPRIEMVPNLDTMLCRIAEGDGYGVFDSISRCLQFDGLAALPLDSEISLCMAQRTGSWNPVVDAFCLAVQESMAAGI